MTYTLWMAVVVLGFFTHFWVGAVGPALWYGVLLAALTAYGVVVAKVVLRL